MASIRVAIAQLNFRLGDFESNVAAIVDAYKKSVEQDADVVVFSELAVCGYPPEDLLLKQRFVEEAGEAVEQIAAQCSETVAIVGFPEGEGQELYNSAAVCCQGEISGIYRKQLLPNYSVFDEKRYFTPGTSAGPIFQIAGVTVGISICEDLWFDDGPLETQIASGADLVISLNASPYQQGKDASRFSAVHERLVDHGLPAVYVNQVGGQDELIFDGSSFVTDSAGDLIAQLPQFEEALQIVDLEVGARSIGELSLIRVSEPKKTKKPIPEPTEIGRAHV